MISFHNGIKTFIILALSFIVFTPGKAAAADFVLILKSGAVMLSDDTQRLDNETRTFDDASNRTLAVAWEIRNSRDVGLGMEYMTFEHDFNSPSADYGYTRTQMYLFSARKYFAAKTMIHPFVGIGLGWGYTQFNRINDIDQEWDTDREWNTALQISTGVEFQFAEEFGIYIEAKGLASGSDSERENEFDFSGSGLMAGVSFIF
jgi:opacity protein-like surface antigen